MENNSSVLTLNFHILTVETGFSVSNITLVEGEEIRISLSTVGIPREDIILPVGIELATAEAEGTEVHVHADNALLPTLLYRCYIDKFRVSYHPC